MARSKRGSTRAAAAAAVAGADDVATARSLKTAFGQIWGPLVVVLVAALGGGVGLGLAVVPWQFWGCDESCLAVKAFEQIRDHEADRAVATFQELLRRDEQDSYAWAWLGRVQVMQQDLPAALASYERAAETVTDRLTSQDDREKLTIRARTAQLELDIRRLKQRMAGAPSINRQRATDGSGELRRGGIERVHWSKLTPDRFQLQYQIPCKPVIITGFPPLGGQNWTLEHLKEQCSHLPTPLQRHSSNSTTWAGMTPLPDSPMPLPFGEFLDEIASGRAQELHPDAMVFDWPLSQGCPELLKTFQVPSLMSSVFTSFGPSMFVQPSGTRSGLHVDAGSTHFWQFLYSGRKRFRVFNPHAWGRLFSDHDWQRAFFRDARCTSLFGDEAYHAAGCDDDFGGAPIDAFDEEELERLASQSGIGLQMREGVIEPGELIYIPANAPHQVQNEGGSAWSIATSVNFVDVSNVVQASTALLEAPEFHPKFLARLRKKGKVVPGSKCQWYERQRIVIDSESMRALRSAMAHSGARLAADDDGLVPLSASLSWAQSAPPTRKLRHGDALNTEAASVDVKATHAYV